MTGIKKQAAADSEVEEKISALLTNAHAIRAIASAVEGTLGPKGLDTMLVDRFGNVVITNDGVTILTMMEANHPAARMLINTAKAQQEQVGDGTTTATVIASALVNEGVDRIARGVPVTRVIEGLRLGVNRALELLEQQAQSLDGLDDPRLRQTALIAGRGREDIADLVVQAAVLLGTEKLLDPAFKLADSVRAEEGAENQVFCGLALAKEPVSLQVKLQTTEAAVLLVDDALEPEQLSEEALRTESGFARYLQLQEEFKENIARIIDLDVKAVLLNCGVADAAAEMLTDAGIMVVQRVSAKDMQAVAEHTGARLLKRTGLRKSKTDLAAALGHCGKLVYQKKLRQLWIQDGCGIPTATVLVGAATAEVVGERERIAKDAAAAVQAAVKKGLIPGGGSAALAIARELEQYKGNVKGMAVYGVECVIESLKQPFLQIVYNAGFNPLEKLGDVLAAQQATGQTSLALDCNTGETADMLALGVVDPALVKIYALKAAGEIAEAVLRIDTIIKKREAGDSSGAVDYNALDAI